MAKVAYCPNCQRKVTPTKKFNWIAFIFFAGIFYLPIYWLKKKKCPICQSKCMPVKKAQEAGLIAGEAA